MVKKNPGHCFNGQPLEHHRGQEYIASGSGEQTAHVIQALRNHDVWLKTVDNEGT